MTTPAPRRLPNIPLVILAVLPVVLIAVGQGIAHAADHAAAGVTDAIDQTVSYFEGEALSIVGIVGVLVTLAAAAVVSSIRASRATPIPAPPSSAPAQWQQ